MSNFIDIIIPAPPIYIDFITPGQKVFIDVVMPLISELTYATLSDWIDPVNYIGKAYSGSAEDAAVWTITKITVAANGTVIETVATGVKWSERLTINYT